MRLLVATIAVVMAQVCHAQYFGGSAPIATVGQFVYRCKAGLAGGNASSPYGPVEPDGESGRALTVIYQTQCLSYIQAFIHGHDASALLSNAFTGNKAAVTHICPPSDEEPRAALAKTIFALELLRKALPAYSDDAKVDTPVLTAMMAVYPCKKLPLGNETPKPERRTQAAGDVGH